MGIYIICKLEKGRCKIIYKLKLLVLDDKEMVYWKCYMKIWKYEFSIIKL